MKPYLGLKGYVVYKETLSDKQIAKVKKDLTIKPYVPETFGPPPESFPIYMENCKKLYLPKFYGIREFGQPSKNKQNDGEDIKIKFKGQLREYQVDPVKVCMTKLNDPAVGGGLLCLGCSQVEVWRLISIILTSRPRSFRSLLRIDKLVGKLSWLT